IDWQTVKEIHDHWQYSQSGMGPGLSIVVAIVVAALTYGAASAAVGTAASATAGSGTAMAAAGTSATGTAVGAGWANAAFSAGLSSMAATATISAINNKGNLGAVLKDTFSEDALTNYAGAAVIGGVGAYTDMWGRTMTANGNKLLVSLSERAGAYTLNTIIKGVVTGANSSDDWATVAAIGLAGEFYQYWVGREPDVKPGVDRAEGSVFNPVDGNHVPTEIINGVVREGKNIGLNQLCDSILAICQGTPISNALNQIPGFNSFATLHDTWMNWAESNGIDNVYTNIGSMPPALLINYGGFIDKYYYIKPVINEAKK
ncbi:MAG: DUF637 domain-containing protein, partial [Azonexus sp.]|nr:DUF637 domain-containing protein [Azonexus sp.]